MFLQTRQRRQRQVSPREGGRLDEGAGGLDQESGGLHEEAAELHREPPKRSSEPAACPHLILKVNISVTRWLDYF